MADAPDGIGHAALAPQHTGDMFRGLEVRIAVLPSVGGAGLDLRRERHTCQRPAMSESVRTQLSGAEHQAPQVVQPREQVGEAFLRAAIRLVLGLHVGVKP